jgi:outer membrane protein OmpA-like peptidoglycan-associated protein
MKSAKARARILVAAICSLAVLHAHADTVRYYGEGSVPDPQVVASVLGGFKPRHGLKMRGGSLWNGPEQLALNDGGRNVSDDSTAAHEEVINANARSALDDWRQQQGAGNRPALALAQPAPVAATAAARPAALAVAITFANDSAQIPTESNRSLDAVAEGMRLVGFARPIIIEGHTNATGSLAHNMRLSKLRAESVKHYLMTQHGIPAEALRAVGMGPKSPLNKQNPYATENRRVQFRVAA